MSPVFRAYRGIVLQFDFIAFSFDHKLLEVLQIGSGLLLPLNLIVPMAAKIAGDKMKLRQDRDTRVPGASNFDQPRS
jgi:hypothetical protein